jgi:hypothetical protein
MRGRPRSSRCCTPCRLTAAHLAGATSDGGELARDFNALLVQAKEHFPQSDTLRLIEPIHGDAGVPVLAVRLVMMRRTLEAALAEGRPERPAEAAAESRRPVEERRRWERRDVAWPVRFLLGEGASITARAVDASRHGLRLMLDGGLTPALVTHGQKCGVEVQLAGSSARFFRIAEVSYVGEHGIGLKIPEALPLGLVPGDAPPLARRHGRLPRGLRSLFRALSGR